MDFTQTPSAPAAEFVLSGCGERLSDTGDRSVEWGLMTDEQSFKIRISGVDYQPEILVVCPAAIDARDAHWETNGLSAGVSGGIVLVHTYYVLPMDVCFANIAVEEVPCNDVILATGYFQHAVAAGRSFASHTRQAGAGRWLKVTEDNRVGDRGEMDFASSGDGLRRMKPDGTYTDDTAFGWLGGTLTWKIPFGWQNPFTGGIVAPFGLFSEDVRQITSITPQGDARVEKFGHAAERKIDGRIYFNGALVR